MSDVRYLPLERMRLLSFLAKWGSFPHITGGACKTCEAAVAGETKPFKITPAPKAAWVQDSRLFNNTCDDLRKCDLLVHFP
eukprot:gene30201-35184_t